MRGSVGDNEVVLVVLKLGGQLLQDVLGAANLTGVERGGDLGHQLPELRVDLVLLLNLFRREPPGLELYFFVHLSPVLRQQIQNNLLLGGNELLNGLDRLLRLVVEASAGAARDGIPMAPVTVAVGGPVTRARTASDRNPGARTGTATDASRHPERKEI